jgi:hypothetical protein
MGAWRYPRLKFRLIRGARRSAADQLLLWSKGSADFKQSKVRGSVAPPSASADSRSNAPNRAGVNLFGQPWLMIKFADQPDSPAQLFSRPQV